MAVLNILSAYSVTKPSGMWEALLGLFDFIGNYGWRVILFTVLLKLVLSPLDFFQKYKMKKNQRITAMLKPEMDRLQKQYANDKTSLQQAQMKMQRSAGFSHFYSCIPMILTLVIFFTFWAGMRNIAPYEEFKQYVELYDAYSGNYTRLTGLEMSGDGGINEAVMEDGKFVLLLDSEIGEWEKGELTAAQKTAVEESANYRSHGGEWFVNMYKDWQNLKGYVQFFNANPVYPNNAADYSGVKSADGTPFLRSEGTLAGSFDIDAVFGGSGAKATAAQNEIITALNAALSDSDKGYNLKVGTTKLTSFNSFDEVVEAYGYLDQEPVVSGAIATFLTVAEVQSAEVSYEYFMEHRPNFLWIKSLWVADVPWSNAIPSFNSFSKNVSSYFKNSNRLIIEREGLSEKELVQQLMDEEGISKEAAEKRLADEKSAILATLNSQKTYDRIMLRIREDKKVSGFNGLLLLGIIAVGLSVLSQFITTRQQKKSGQIAGSAAGMGNSMKIMYYIMPLITGVMAVMYTATFAVYMVTNSLMTLATNLLSTLIIGFVFKKKSKDEMSDTGIIRYGRRDPNDNVKKDK